MNSAALMILALSTGPVWQTDWLGNATEGQIDATYRITEDCQLELMSVKSDPPGLSKSDAVKTLKRILVYVETEIDMDAVFARAQHIPKGETLTEKQYRELMAIADELGPWPEKRGVRLGDRYLVCEFNKNGELEKAAISENGTDMRPLSSIPLQTYRLSFKVEGE